MNRTEFMRQLESLLQNISRTEREEALQYYNDYFDDAGSENEQDVLEALGNPARVAESIKRDRSINSSTEDMQGNSVRNPIIKRSEEQNNDQNHSDASKPEEMPTWKLVLLIVGGIILSPIVLGLISGGISVIFGLIVSWFCVILGVGVAAFVLIMLLFVLGAVGIMHFIEAPLAGVGLIGGGLICGGLGILFLMLTVALAGIVTPAIFKGIGKLWRFLAGKIKREVIA